MPLTPIDIQQKTFGPELRGYNMDEVDDFLDEVVSTLKDYDQRLRDAQDRIRALEAEVATRGEDETAISRALVAAQKQADVILNEAQEEAERIRSQAHNETEQLRAERDSERMSLTQEIARMRATVADLKRRVVDLAASAGSDLDAMDEAAAAASSDIGGRVDEDTIENDTIENDVTEEHAVTAYESASVGGTVEPFPDGDDTLDAEGTREDGAFDEEPADEAFDEDDLSEIDEDLIELDDAEDEDEDDAEAEDVDVEGEYADDEQYAEPDEGGAQRSAQHLSDGSGQAAGRRPWERGSV